MTGDFAWPDLPKISTPLSDLPKIGPHPYKIHFCPDLFLSNFCPKRVTGTIGDRMSATSAISKVISIQFCYFYHGGGALVHSKGPLTQNILY